MNERMYEVLNYVLDKYSNVIIHHKLMSNIRQYEMERSEKLSENLNDIVRCKDCKFYVVSGCKILKQNVQVYLANNIVVSQWCTNNRFIPDRLFGCTLGKAKEKTDTDCDHSQTSPKKVMQKDDTLDKLFHKTKALRVSPSPSTIDAYIRINDICDILTIMVTYLMAKEKGE